MSAEPSVIIENIGKSFGKKQALGDISFEVEPGELFGLIGPDGAGKTTLFRILSSLLLPDSGRASVAGWDCARDYKQIRNNIGYMPGRFSLYYDLSVEENLNFFATVFRTTVKENYHLIRDIYVQLEPFRERPAGKLSGGMKQKLALCCALIHRPLVLFLDEPTTGVDAVSRKEFWEMLKKLKENGITILVSTPYMDEAVLCERIALIQEGRILDLASPQQLTENFARPLYSVRGADLYRVLKDLQKDPLTHSCYPFGQELHWSPEKTLEPGEAAEFFRRKGFEGIVCEPIRAGVEDCFMELMTKHEH